MIWEFFFHRSLVYCQDDFYIPLVHCQDKCKKKKIVLHWSSNDMRIFFLYYVGPLSRKYVHRMMWRFFLYPISPLPRSCQDSFPYPADILPRWFIPSNQSIGTLLEWYRNIFCTLLVYCYNDMKIFLPYPLVHCEDDIRVFFFFFIMLVL